MGRCEACQTKRQHTDIERLRCKNERRKQEGLDNPGHFSDRAEEYREANSENIKANRIVKLR